MTQEEREADKELREVKEREKREDYDRLYENYKKLSYRDKLLFLTVMKFLINNPENTEKS
jgi:hypothetical protein